MSETLYIFPFKNNKGNIFIKRVNANSSSEAYSIIIKESLLIQKVSREFVSKLESYQKSDEDDNDEQN